jgi:hypothetical protein
MLGGMEQDSWKAPPFSRTAISLFTRLVKHAGCVRVAPLLRDTDVGADELADAVNELAERGWVKIVWRPEGARLPAELPQRFRPVERITATRFGRYRYPMAVWLLGW